MENDPALRTLAEVVAGLTEAGVDEWFFRDVAARVEQDANGVLHRPTSGCIYEADLSLPLPEGCTYDRSLEFLASLPIQSGAHASGVDAGGSGLSLCGVCLSGEPLIEGAFTDLEAGLTANFALAIRLAQLVATLEAHLGSSIPCPIEGQVPDGQRLDGQVMDTDCALELIGAVRAARRWPDVRTHEALGHLVAKKQDLYEAAQGMITVPGGVYQQWVERAIVEKGWTPANPLDVRPTLLGIEGDPFTGLIHPRFDSNLAPAILEIYAVPRHDAHILLAAPRFVVDYLLLCADPGKDRQVTGVATLPPGSTPALIETASALWDPLDADSLTSLSGAVAAARLLLFATA